VRYLVTGTAGFIGFHVAKLLIDSGHTVCGLDGMTAYYDVALKRRRHAMLLQSSQFTAHEVMLEDVAAFRRVYEEFTPDVVIHLAAQAGVRYSIENPRAYVDSNLVGTFNLLELVREFSPKHFLLASTSSVYGANEKIPFEESDRADHPLTLYAATKKATEVMAHSYAHLWNIPTTAFRFFTVYGPWGRPDMAPFKFTKGILDGTPIEIFNNGDMRRDFTYIDDLARAVVLLSDAIPNASPDDAADNRLGVSPSAPFRIVNIGNGEPVNLLAFVESIERAIGKKAIRKYLPMQQGDVSCTFADSTLLRQLTGFRPATPVDAGMRKFVEWYRNYYNV
jgi:UDP-glucuronate 4-epimerase